MTNDELKRNVAASVQAALTALKHLESSLRAGGFESGASTYVRLGEILLGQWGWSSSYGDGDLQDRFRELGKTAQRVHDLLSPYEKMLGRVALFQAQPAAPVVAGEEPRREGEKAALLAVDPMPSATQPAEAPAGVASEHQQKSGRAQRLLACLAAAGKQGRNQRDLETYLGWRASTVGPLLRRLTTEKRIHSFGKRGAPRFVVI